MRGDMWILVRSAMIVSLVVLLGACGGGGGDAPIASGSAGSFGSVDGGGSFTSGETATLSVQVVGDPGQFSLQWYKDSVAVSDDSRISGSQTNELTITNLQPSDGGAYQLSLTDNVSGSGPDSSGGPLDPSSTIYSSAISVSVSSTPINNAPNAFAQTVATAQDTEVQITLSGDDGESPSSQTLTYILTALPGSGTVSLSSGGAAIASGLPLTLSGPTLFFMPGSGFSGTDTFNFRVQDDGGTADGGVDLSAVATITINVSSGAPVNNAPNANAQSLSISVDTEVQVTLTGDDGESPSSQSLTYILSALPANGIVSLTSGGTAIASGLPLTLSGPTLFYTPGSGFTGADTFRFKVQDDGGTANGGVDLSTEATITINVSAPAVGWTTFTPSADTIIYYVSNSDGNDANDGLSTATPFKTLTKGLSSLQDGFPDWLLLKKGDTWASEGLNSWGGPKKSGRSPSEPLLLSTYGASTERPIVGGNSLQSGPEGLYNVSIVGIHFVTQGYDGTGDKNGVFLLGNNSDILIEDCKFTMGRVDFVPYYGTLLNISFRRNVVVDAYRVASSGHSTGLYAAGVTNLLIEECVFDHNGWNDAVSGAHPTVYNHNIYLGISNPNTILRGNISTRASSHGIQSRTGGVVEDNLLAHNPIGLLFGGSDEQTPGGISGNISRNVLLHGNDIDGANARGWGISLNNINATGVVADNNIIAHHISALVGGMGFGVSPRAVQPIRNLLIRDNIVYDWYRPVRVTAAFGPDNTGIVIQNNQFQTLNTLEPLIGLRQGFSAADMSLSGNTYYSGKPVGAWFTADNWGSFMSHADWVTLTGETGSQVRNIPYVDPNRDLASYHASLGKTGTFEAFIAEARLQSKANWRPEYTAAAVNAYIRAGFTE